MDEVEETDYVVILHRGQVLAQGAVPGVVAAANARDIRTAFIRLTRDSEDEDELA